MRAIVGVLTFRIRGEAEHWEVSSSCSPALVGLKCGCLFHEARKCCVSARSRQFGGGDRYGFVPSTDVCFDAGCGGVFWFSLGRWGFGFL